MPRYIIKESELRSVIKKVVTEELNEGLTRALGNALLNTAKYAAIGAIAPGALAQKGVLKAADILGGKSTIGGTVSDFFGSNGKTRAQRDSEKVLASKNIAYEYGKPEVVPSWGNRVKLDEKSEIVAPPYDERKRTGCMLPWGSFGVHYHDEGDRTWNRLIVDKEKAILRVSGDNESKRNNLLRKYKKKLVEWLNDRDKAYRKYIKENNKL